MIFDVVSRPAFGIHTPARCKVSAISSALAGLKTPGGPMTVNRIPRSSQLKAVDAGPATSNPLGPVSSGTMDQDPWQPVAGAHPARDSSSACVVCEISSTTTNVPYLGWSKDQAMTLPG